ncbi:MAG: N-formylglutamate deformylase [Gammaproteobacteria bacterium]
MSPSVSIDHPVYRLHRGSAPLLVSIPHMGTELPAALRAGYTAKAAQLADTDWHLDRLYAFAESLGASVIGARISRYVIDLNRPPGGESLYPGQTTTGLCPTETFRGEPLYLPGEEPDDAQRAQRVEEYWKPYHRALEAELARLRALHGRVLLWEAHSIASHLPRLFEGKLPDLNFGTNDGRACDTALLEAALEPLRHGAPVGLTHVVNGRFKGGYITRHYGRPEAGVHAIQLEMCQSVYMDEEAPFAYRPERAAIVQPLLRNMIASALGHLGRAPVAERS